MTDEDVPEGAAEALQHYFDTRHEFLSWLGVEVAAFERGRAVLKVPYQPKLTNKPPEGIDLPGIDDDRPPVQGGVASTLIDVAGGIALRPYLDDPVTDGMATINLNVNYLRQATGDLTARAEVVRAGHTVGVSQVDLESEPPDGEPSLVAVGQGAYRLFSG